MPEKDKERYTTKDERKLARERELYEQNKRNIEIRDKDKKRAKDLNDPASKNPGAAEETSSYKGKENERKKRYVSKGSVGRIG